MQLRWLHLSVDQLGAGGSVHPFNTVKDYEDWLKRLDDYIAFLDTSIANMKEGMAKGIVLPKVLTEKTIVQLEEFITKPVEEHLFYRPIQSMPEGISQSDRDRLAEEYQNRSVSLVEVAGGFRFQVSDALAPYLANLTDEKPGKYSRATLETLAMIAYRQPVTRGEIEAVRGVAVNTQIIRTLEERGWITVVGHKEVPGRPALFATTIQFLDDFGLKSLEQLPNAEDLIATPTTDLLDQMEQSSE